MAMLSRKMDRKVQGLGATPVDPCELALQVPTLYDYLGQTAWPDGTVRQTSSLLLFQQDGMFKGMLKDTECGLCLWIAGKSLTGLLASLEAALNDPNAEWRVDRQVTGQVARRVKK